jgi:hypothetical protein
MIRPMETRDKDAVLGLVRATGFFTEAEVGVARVPDFYRAGDDRVIYAKYFR